MTQALSPRERLLAGIPGALDALKGVRKKAETTERTLDAVGVAHKATTVTKEEAAKGVIDDMKADLTKILSKYVEIDDKMAAEITAMVLSAALNAGAEAEAPPPELPEEEMAVDDPDPDAETPPPDDEMDDEDDPLAKVKSLQSINAKLVAVNDRLMKSQDDADALAGNVTKSVMTTNKRVDDVLKGFEALESRLSLIEGKLAQQPRASKNAVTRLEDSDIPSDVLKELNAALVDVVNDPVWGAVKRK